MNVGDLVKLKWRGNGHPKVGLIVASFEDAGAFRHKVLWECPEWSVTLWKERELVVISESR
jgi:hypothetical protein